jgi:hypothetical protein
MPRLRLAAVAAGVAMAAAGALVLAPNASAATPRSTAGLHAHIPMGSGAMRSAVPSTNYGAGYFSYPGAANGTASANVTFTMPSITCFRPGDAEWLLPGIWVYDSSGNLTQQVDVNFNCNSGSQLREDVICIQGASCDQSLSIAPGDRIQASLAYTSSATVGRIHDLTSGASAQVVGPAITTDYTVFIGDEGPSLFGVRKVPVFTAVPFSSAYVNGQSLADWSAAQYNLKTGTSLQIATGVLTGDGNAFVTTFHHSA